MVNFTNNFNTDAVTGAAIQTSLDQLNTGLSSLTDANFKAGATIAATRLGTISVDLEYEVVLQVQSQITLPTGIVGFVPVEEGVTLTGASWVCDDIGGGTSVASIEWGYFDTGGSWVQVADLGTINFTDKGGGTGEGDVSISDTTLTAGGNVRGLALNFTTADGTMLTGADAKTLAVSFRLKKTITV